MPQFRYVPTLRWKRGEKVGLQRLSASGRQDVVPLFVHGGDRYVGRAATRQRPAITPPNLLASELFDVWSTAPFYFDAASLPHSPPIQHPFTDIAISARARGLGLIPATRLGAPAAYQAAVNAVAAADGRGVALRVGMADFATAANWLPAWPHLPADTDLILDLGDNVSNVLALGAAIDPAFITLHQGSRWRTVTVIGTSMPENFAGFTQGPHPIGRTELALWARLSAVGLPYRLDYGDYATVPVIPPPTGIRWGYPFAVAIDLDASGLREHLP